MDKYSILLVDDEELALRGMEEGIHWELLGIDRVYKRNSMKSAQEFLEKTCVDLMVCDIEMPGGSGIELIRWVREQYPGILCIFYTCHADFSYCQEALKMGALDYVVKPIPYEELEQVLGKALLTVEKNKAAKGLENLWGELTRQEKKESPVEKVKKIIAENISVEMSREELAAQVFMSPDYLTKLFKKETGMSLSDYIIKKRISLAQQLLNRTELSVVEISQRAGFSYSSYFVRIFKKKTGLTPQQYREVSRKERQED